MGKTEYQPDYTNILQVLYNRRPGRLPVYEHHIDVPFISKVLGREITPGCNKPADLDALTRVMPPGMKAFGGCGYGIFKACQELVGYEQLCIMLYFDPDLFTDIFARIGNLYNTLWSEMIKESSDWSTWQTKNSFCTAAEIFLLLWRRSLHVGSMPNTRTKTR